MKSEDLITISLTLPIGKLLGVYALLGGVASVSVSSPVAAKEEPAPKPDAVKGETARSTDDVEEVEEVETGDVELDADGHPWSKELHASTKAKTGAQLWRMKPGATRPAPMPGFPKDGGTGTASTDKAPAAAKPAPATTTAVDEDDEFAAFTAAAGKDAGSAAPTARTWSDQDLSKLNNQAAAKLGGADKIKAIVAEYMEEGSITHSRLVPADKREEYAQKVEALAGVEFEG